MINEKIEMYMENVMNRSNAFKLLYNIETPFKDVGSVAYGLKI